MGETRKIKGIAFMVTNPQTDPRSRERSQMLGAKTTAKPVDKAEGKTNMTTKQGSFESKDTRACKTCRNNGNLSVAGEGRKEISGHMANS